MVATCAEINVPLMPSVKTIDGVQYLICDKCGVIMHHYAEDSCIMHGLKTYYVSQCPLCKKTYSSSLRYPIKIGKVK